MTDEQTKLSYVSEPLGVEESGTICRILEKFVVLPMPAVLQYFVAVRQLDLHLVQGYSTNAAANKSIARFSVREIPPGPPGTLSIIKILIEVDLRGNVSFRATENTLGITLPVFIDYNRPISISAEDRDLRYC